MTCERGADLDLSGQPVGTYVAKGNVEGLSIQECWSAQIGGAGGTLSNKALVGLAGWTGEQMLQCAAEMRIVEDDCGTGEGARVEVERLGAKDAGVYRGSVLAKPAGGFAAGTEIDGNVAKRLSMGSEEEVFVRTPWTCASTDGCCRTCLGDGKEGIGRSPAQTEAGMLAAQSLNEANTQPTLSILHSDGVLVKKVRVETPTEQLLHAMNPGARSAVGHAWEVAHEGALAEGRSETEARDDAKAAAAHALWEVTEESGGQGASGTRTDHGRGVVPGRTVPGIEGGRSARRRTVRSVRARRRRETLHCAERRCADRDRTGDAKAPRGARTHEAATAGA